MEFGILGPLEVRSDDGPIHVSGAKQRVLLAVLLLRVGEVVSADRLLETIWGDDQPANPRNALQSQVSQLRRTLGPAGRDLVAARPPGYVLLAAPESVDAARFERLVRDGRTGLRDRDERAAAASLDAALDLWRGPPLEEFAGQAFADPVITRLTELRLGAIEDRIQCDLEAGRHYELVPDLETLVRAHPLRERLRGQLMLALARAGRQADALEVFHDTRRVLDDELGIDPSPELARLYETLLRQTDEPPARAPDPPPDSAPPSLPAAIRLPRPFSSFVGRDDDLGRVIDLMAGSRLVTLTGPGGVGKTRLAVEAAIRAVESGVAPDGGWLVELSALDDPALLDETTAQALDLRSHAGLAAVSGEAGSARARVAAALSGRRALLVLDNCEHLVHAAADFARDLLMSADLVTVLCTSREALGVPGETVWSVTSLTLPPDGTEAVPEELSRWGATQLFIDRARAADPHFALDRETAALVVEVSRQLDGIPLALELAAARVRTLGLGELAARLDDRFAVLTSGDRTAQPRQQTLRAVVEWSWDLLDDAERALFRRLSVFAGGARLDAIEEVCSDPERVPADEAVTLASALADKSMVTVDRARRPPRYRMLETLRAFAADRLADSDEAAAVRSRHADHLRALAAAEVPKLRTDRQLDAMRRLDAERDDLRAALRYLAEAGDAARGARLATDLGWYWYLRGLRAEGLRWLATFAELARPRERALAQLWSAFLEPRSAAPVQERVEDAITVLATHGSATDHTFGSLVASVLHASLGNAEAGGRHRVTARRLIEQTGDDRDAALADFVEGHAGLVVGDLAGALPWLETALDRFTALGDRWGQVQCLIALLSCAEMTGDLAAALRHADRGIELSDQLRLREMETILHCRRATVATLAGDHDAAAQSVRRAGELAEELGTAVVAGNANMAAGFLALRSGQLDAAERHFERVLDWIGESPYPAIRSYTLARLGTVAELMGDHDRALGLLRDSFAAATASGDPRSEAFALEGLAAAYSASGRFEDAAVLLGAAEARRDAVGLPLPPPERTDVERAEAAARAHLGEAAFAAASTRGRSFGPGQLPVH